MTRREIQAVRAVRLCAALLLGSLLACSAARQAPGDSERRPPPEPSAASRPEPTQTIPPPPPTPAPTPTRPQTPPQRLTEAQLNASEPYSGPMPIEPDKTPSEPFVSVNGKPFPPPAVFALSLPAPRRTFYASPALAEEGDGSEARPWKDLQAALCALSPGDRLIVKPGVFAGSYEVSGSCRDGTEEAPIQVVMRGAILRPASEKPALTLERAHWSLDGLWVVLADFNSTAVLTRGRGAHHIVLDHCQIYQGAGSGVTVGAGSSFVTISNSHIHNMGLLSARSDFYAVQVERGARDVTVIANKLHHVSGGSIRVGAGPSSENAPETLSITGNRIHNDRGPGILVLEAHGVRIADNTMYNYRPVRAGKGEAIWIAGGSAVRIEGNHIAESTVGVRLGGGEPGDPGPEDVLLLRNYLENHLTRQAVAVALDAVRNVRIYNNVVDHYGEGLRLAAGPPQVEAVSVANNIVMRVRAFAFRMADPAAATYFDQNVFSPLAEQARVEVGGETLDLKDYLARGGMPATRALPGVRLLAPDLARIGGVSLVDAGKALDGIPFKGAAPDLGVAEQ